MDIATQLGIGGASEGTLVLAESQTKGRGRLGRNWVSPKYKGIYFSLILKPKILPSRAPLLTLLAGVSLVEAIKDVIGLEARIKWPNDILLHNKKVGGILTELNSEMDEIHFVVIGIGLNVNNDRKTLVDGATSLKEEKRVDINRIELLQEILRRIENNYLSFYEKGSSPVIKKWLDYNVTLGRRVKVVSHTKHIEGQAIDIDPDGALLIRKDSGLSERITAGDVLHCR
jgi:BirA family biotin operon repressor/biotin-[acetyl-CoA-carboxylase] ligase